MSLIFSCDNREMSSDGKWDYQREAMAAMKLAIAADGLERMRWIRIAQAWQDLGRWVERRSDTEPSPSIVHAEHD